MKDYVLLLLCCLYSVVGWGQVNYVLNPGMEIYDTCPNDNDQIADAFFWNSLDTLRSYVLITNGEAEYLNRCAGNNPFCGVPRNQAYFHYPHSGNGMAQVQMYFDESYPEIYKRDYLQGKLRNSLIANHNYCVTFYVTLEQASGYGINKISAYCDNGIIDTTHSPGSVQYMYNPQINENTIINDTLNWFKIEGTFTASGNEKFITIGNFSDTANTAHVHSISGSTLQFSWYLVDDVSVIESNTIANVGNDTIIHQGDSILIGEIAVPYTWYKRTAAGLSLIDSVSGGIWVKPDSTTTYVVKLTLCGVVTWDSIKVTVVPVGISNLNLQFKYLLIYPVPTNDAFFIENATIGTTYSLGDITGRQLMQGQINAAKQSLNISQLASGTYLLQLFGEDGSKEIRKIVKQ